MVLVPALVGLFAAAVVLLWTGPAAVPVRASESELASSSAADGSATVAGARPRTTVRQDVDRLLRRLGVGRADRARDLELRVLDGLAAALEAGLPVPQAVTLAVSGAPSETGRTQGLSRRGQRRRGQRRRGQGRRGQGRRRRGPGRGGGGELAPASGWDELARAAAQGQALAPVWQRLARREDSPTLDSVARAWRVSALTGAPLARGIRVSAHVSRERRRLERAVQVATAGARATVTVLTLLPLAGVGLAVVLGVSPVALYAHPVALASAGAGAVLVVVGQFWSRRLVGRVLRGVR